MRQLAVLVTKTKVEADCLQKKVGENVWEVIDLPERFDRSPISHTARKAREMPSALPVL
mgnify:CR=1 FL=1